MLDTRLLHRNVLFARCNLALASPCFSLKWQNMVGYEVDSTLAMTLSWRLKPAHSRRDRTLDGRLVQQLRRKRQKDEGRGVGRVIQGDGGGTAEKTQKWGG